MLIFFIIINKIIQGQISPGELTKAHAHLEGLSNCTKCHVLGEQVYNSKCLDCHSEINKKINEKNGYHSLDEVKGKDCWTCHSEHHGRNFRIINLNTDNFDHKKTGFELTGSHKKLECSSCHQNKFIKGNELKQRPGTYLGLEQNCFYCHQDVHKGTLGINCSDCHNTQKFIRATRFDHNKSSYKLTGSHKTVDCNKCHPVEEKEGEKFQKFKGISFKGCFTCHRDIHKGLYGADCQKCHSTNSFHKINQSAFDHSKTNFPLIGKHTLVNCNDCHKTGLSSKIKYKKCSDCHSDYHKGEFAENGIINDCAVCHIENGFTPSLFTIEKHNKSEFHLSGSHLAVPCAGCHLKNEKWFLKRIGSECIDCHNNIHGQEISIRFMGNNNCSGCHNSISWSLISFQHDKTGFTLLGKHIEVDCRNCHYKKDINSISEVSRFKSLGKDCLICHEDYHQRQFKNSECENCHSFNNWRPEKFDHNKTRFSLQGTHTKLDCIRCHNVTTINNVSFILYKIEKVKCADCHS